MLVPIPIYYRNGITMEPPTSTGIGIKCRFRFRLNTTVKTANISMQKAFQGVWASRAIYMTSAENISEPHRHNNMINYYYTKSIVNTHVRIVVSMYLALLYYVAQHDATL